MLGTDSGIGSLRQPRIRAERRKMTSWHNRRIEEDTMDDKRFDAWIRDLSNERAPRRNALKGLAAGALALATGWLALDGAEAKKRKKKRKKKNRCPSPRLVCTDNNNAAGCCLTECCLHILEPEGGDTVCRPRGYVCCTAEEGGGACAPEYPFCCAPTDEFPEGFCSVTEAGCEELLSVTAVATNQRAPRIGRRSM